MNANFLRKLREDIAKTLPGGLTQQMVADAITRTQVWVSRREDSDHNLTIVSMMKLIEGIAKASGKGTPVVTISFSFEGDDDVYEYEFD